jgi:hypothetical protein
MNRTPDVERVLRDYFADDGLTAPDYILDTVEGRISRHRQRRSWRLPWRNPMSTPFKLAAGLAAVVLVALVGWQLLPGQPGIGGPQSPTPTQQPSATPVASASPSPASSSSAVFPEWWTSDSPPNGAGILQSGSQATRSFRPGFTFSVPEGWVNEGDSDGIYSLFPDTPANEAEFARSGALAQSMFMGPNSSPYFVCESVENNRGTTAAEMVAAVTANEVLATTGLVDVAIGGLTGKQFDVRLNPDWAGTCPPAPDDPPDLLDVRTRVILLDAPGRGVIVIFIGSMYSADFEAFLAEAMPIIESFEFDLGQ